MKGYRFSIVTSLQLIGFIAFEFCNAFLCHPQLTYSDFKDFIINRNYAKNDSIHSASSKVRIIELLGSSELLIGKTVTASDVMVDVTNELAFTIMYQHSLYNRNNIAFSPTSLMSVLIALYEGSIGQSSNQLKLVLNLPDNKDISRVGHRDIQRRLKTYILDSHNPLKGLSFNKESIVLLPNYEAIMAFYGYNLVMDRTSNTTADSHQTVSNQEAVEETTASLKLHNTSTSTPPQVEKTTVSSFAQQTTSHEKSNAFNATMEKPVTSISVTEIPNPRTTTIASLDNANASEMSTEGSVETFARLQKPTEVYTMRQTSTHSPSDFPTSTLAPHQPNNQSNLLRMKRQPFHQHPYPSYTTYNQPNISDGKLSADEGAVYTEFNRNRSLNSSQLQGENHITHNFYVSDHHIVYAVFKVYNAILFYKHFDDMQLTVVEMELNSSEYNLIIFLPDSKSDLTNPIIYIKFALNLRLVRTVLKPKFVQIIIPDIHLNGDVYLTSDLQNMGICDIFEPKQANLQAMTNDKDVYVKHIQQMVKINLGIQTINSKLNSNSDVDQTEPTQVSVNHPFIFFIMDRHLNVAIMAGRILNPLNARIQ